VERSVPQPIITGSSLPGGRPVVAGGWRIIRTMGHKIIRLEPVNGFAAESGLSDAEIALCFEYAAENTPLDLQKLFRRSGSQGPAARSQEP